MDLIYFLVGVLLMALAYPRKLPPFRRKRIIVAYLFSACLAIGMGVLYLADEFPPIDAVFRFQSELFNKKAGLP
ncbi:hypothetical protein [Paenibacillus sp. y28]|uniref:hypothetical protein n=1 Tax=Paenibacillus sp. y28 TaxID=3129110 RepID=UPI0030190204